MGPNDPADDTGNPLRSTRPPFLPACMPQQIMHALLSPEGQAAGFLHGTPLPGIGLSASLSGNAYDQFKPQKQGLAAGLSDRGITQVPGCDPRLVDVTTDPDNPMFQTAQGSTIKMNQPAPQTTLPEGSGMDRLIAFADQVGASDRNPLVITGGSESWAPDPDHPGKLKLLHSQNSAHTNDRAIDVGGPAHNAWLDDETVRKAALAAGFNYGIYEIRPGSKPGAPPQIHWHLQVGPENIKGAELYDLRRGPIRTKDYTKTGKPHDGGG